MFKLTITSIIMAVFGLSQLAFSEEMPKAGKRMNVDYYEVVLVKYKAGKAGEAGKIIRNHFAPAGEAAGTAKPFVMHMQTGDWDSVFFWKQKGGMGAFDWYMDADGEKWFAEFAKQSGGKDKADKIWADYNALIAKTSRQIGHHHNPPKEEAAK